MQGQVRFDGRTVNTVRLEVPGYGKVSFDLDGDDPKLRTGDRIRATCEFVVVKESFGEKHNKDGFGVDDPELVYQVQGVRPFVVDQVRRKAEIDSEWAAKVSATA
jgi:hypothetical protein